MLCQTRVGNLDDLYQNLVGEGINNVKIVAIGKSEYEDSNSDWTNENSIPVLVDLSPYETWTTWGASQRDLFFLDANGEYVTEFNISTWDSDGLGGQNLRLFDVPACGAFLLTEYSEELSEHYRLGVEIETFKTPDELRDKVDYYLKHPVERERIAKLGYERVLKLPNYETRMKEMIKYIEVDSLRRNEH